MYYSGIDLHKKTCFITTIDERGAIVKQDGLPNDEALILHYFFSLGTSHKAVVECTANWYWISDLLTDHGIELVLGHAKYLKAISYAKVKTDKVDSFTLAKLLRMELIPLAHQIDRENRGLRDLMRARLRLVSKRVSCINSIHRILEKFNLSVPEETSLGSLVMLDRLSELPLSADYQLQVRCLRDQISLFEGQIKGLEKSLQPVLVPNPDIQRLLGIPGIGKISAFTIYLEIDGIERFEEEKKFFSYCRLVPGADNSSGRHKHKSGSKDGNRYLKIAFMDATVKAIRFYQPIGQFYRGKARRKHPAIARTLVAKELAKIVYYVLKEKAQFRSFKGVLISKKR